MWWSQGYWATGWWATGWWVEAPNTPITPSNLILIATLAPPLYTACIAPPSITATVAS